MTKFDVAASNAAVNSGRAERDPPTLDEILALVPQGKGHGVVVEAESFGG